MKTKILIVDDELDVLDLMKELFESRGYLPLTATNGVEALKIVREEEPDMVISDIRMPDMDGMQLLEVLSNSYPNIPVIMVTAHGTIETAVEAIKMGAKDYVLKPLRLDEILAKQDLEWFVDNEQLIVKPINRSSNDLEVRASSMS